MSIARSLIVHNGHAFPLADCPVLPMEQFRQEIVDGIAAGGRLAAFFAYPDGAGELRLLAALARADEGDVAVVSVEVGPQYAALTPDCPQAHLYEREIFEQRNVRPVGHPWLKPVRFPPPVHGMVTTPKGTEEVVEEAFGERATSARQPPPSPSVSSPSGERPSETEPVSARDDQAAERSTARRFRVQIDGPGGSRG